MARVTSDVIGPSPFARSSFFRMTPIGLDVLDPLNNQGWRIVHDELKDFGKQEVIPRLERYAPEHPHMQNSYDGAYRDFSPEEYPFRNVHLKDALFSEIHGNTDLQVVAPWWAEPTITGREGFESKGKVLRFVGHDGEVIFTPYVRGATSGFASKRYRGSGGRNSYEEGNTAPEYSAEQGDGASRMTWLNRGVSSLVSDGSVSRMAERVILRLLAAWSWANSSGQGTVVPTRTRTPSGSRYTGE